MSDVDPLEFGRLISKVEALTEQLAYTTRNTEKNMDKLFIQFAAYLESNNARHDEGDARHVLALQRISNLENERKSFADKITGGVTTVRYLFLLAFAILLFAVKGMWEGISWIGGYFGK